jgi:hypothetical protein
MVEAVDDGGDGRIGADVSDDSTHGVMCRCETEKL